jgi:hypothetical protein
MIGFGASSSLTLAAAASPDLNETVAQSTSQEATSSLHVEDGIYLYGQATEPEQVGSAYMVFEAIDNKVVGAFYMPYSSFDCFYGQLNGEQLGLTVIDSYEQTPHPYAVALAQTSDVATAGEAVVAPLQLEGFHRIDTVSENDHRILEVCQTNYGDQQ